MKLESLNKLYVTELRELYNAEKQILIGLPKMAVRATNPQLKQAFEQHRMETEVQISRLEQIFKKLGKSPKGETSRAALGLLAEGDKVIKSKGDSDVIDAGLIAGAQKIEHNEIACYGTAIAHAKMLGDQEAIQLLQQNLDEEYATDKKLTAIAEQAVNREAAQTSGSSNTYNSSYSSYGSYQENSNSSDGGAGISVAALLLGAAAGVAAGILLAPSSGTEIRRKIADSATSLSGQLGNLPDSARSLLGQKNKNGNLPASPVSGANL